MTAEQYQQYIEALRDGGTVQIEDRTAVDHEQLDFIIRASGEEVPELPGTEEAAPQADGAPVVDGHGVVVTDVMELPEVQEIIASAEAEIERLDRVVAERMAELTREQEKSAKQARRIAELEKKASDARSASSKAAPPAPAAETAPAPVPAASNDGDSGVTEQQ